MLKCAMGFIVVAWFALHGLLVAAFPASDYGGDLGLLLAPEEGVAEFTTSDITSVVGESACPEFLSASPIIPPTNIVLESSDSTDYTGIDEDIATMNTENNEADINGIPNKVVLGALLADAIMKEKGTEVDATLAELDAFVEAEIENLRPQIQSAIANASEMNDCVDATLFKIESKIDSELAVIDAFINSELSNTEELVQSVTDNADEVASLFEIVDCLNETNEKEMNNFNMTGKEALIARELEIVESLIETQLAKTETIIEYELEKINSFVKSVDGVVESELAKVDSFVETELAKSEAFVETDLLKLESFVDAELAKIKRPVEETYDLSDDPEFTTNPGDFDYPSVSSSSELDEDMLPSESVHISGLLPVSGRTIILGHTGCPPIMPTDQPLPLFVESFPVLDDSYGVEYEDAYGELESQIFNNANPPIISDCSPFIRTQVTESGDNPGSIESVTIHPQITALPTVNLSNMAPDGKIVVGGNLQFSGTAKATGATSLRAQFPCAPLTATEVGPDGKKYIWLAKKPVNNVPKLPRSEFPTYSAEFPETIIMDSTKNYEKLMSEDLDVDYGVLSVPVTGEAYFEGTAPAFGSVSIRGHCG